LTSLSASSSLADADKYCVKKWGKKRTLGVYDRLVTSIFCHSELRDQSEHLCAWFHVVITSAPGGDGALTRFIDLFISNGMFVFLA